MSTMLDDYPLAYIDFSTPTTDPAFCLHENVEVQDNSFTYPEPGSGVLREEEQLTGWCLDCDSEIALPKPPEYED